MVFVTPLIEEMNHLAKYETGEIVFGILSKTLFCKTILPAVGELHRFTGHMKLRVHLAFVLEKGLWWHMSLDHCSPLALKTSYRDSSSFKTAVAIFCSRLVACLLACRHLLFLAAHIPLSFP